MAKSVVFVCGFNKGRSVASEYIFRHLLLKRDEKLAQQVMVSSAGLLIKQDIDFLKQYGRPAPKPAFRKPCYENMVTLLLKRGMDVSGYRSRGLTRPIVEEADLIIVSEEYPPVRKAAICSFWPFAKDKVFTWREFVEAEVEGEYLPTEDPYPPSASSASLDYTVEYWEQCLAEIEGYLAQRMDKFLSYL
jgi:protein-tyrosine-phosphatase